MKKMIFYLFVLNLLISSNLVVGSNSFSKIDNIHLKFNKEWDDTLYDYRINRVNSAQFLDIDANNKEVFFTLNYARKYSLNKYLNRTLNKTNFKRVNLQGICKEGSYFYSFDESTFKSIIKFNSKGDTIKEWNKLNYLPLSPSAEGLDCTKNYVWLLEDGADGGDLHLYAYENQSEYGRNIDGGCDLPNTNSGLWVEDNEEYLWRTEYTGQGDDIFLYRYHYNGTGCELRNNLSLSSFNISITGSSGGITGSTDKGKLWIGVNKGSELDKGNVYEFNIEENETSDVNLEKPDIDRVEDKLTCKANVSNPGNISIDLEYTWFGDSKEVGTGKYIRKADFYGNKRIKCQTMLHYNNENVSKNSSAYTPYSRIQNRSLIITNTSWKNILSVTSLEVPTIVSNDIDKEVKHFIDRYEPNKIYLIGNNQYDIESKNAVKLEDLSEISKILYAGKSGILVDSLKKGIMASGFASILNRPLIFKDNGNMHLDLRDKSYEEISEKYLDVLDNREGNTNYLVISRNNYPLAGLISARREAYPILIDEEKVGDSNFVRDKIDGAVEELSERDFYVNSPEYILNEAYMLFTGGVKSVNKDDPVEGVAIFNDPKDGEHFKSDLDYGDLNNDGRVDVSVGRLPKNEKLASIMIARTHLDSKDKKALATSEYLYTAWPVILSYLGGGMFNGKTISNTLRREDYNVSRLVEHRARPIQFLTSLTPVNIRSFLDQSKKIGDRVSSLVGKNIGNAVSKVLVSIKALKYAEEGLEMYLEYRWDTFGPKLSNARDVARSIVTKKTKTPQKIAAKLVYILWPNPYPKLSVENLKSEMKDSNIIYYEGLGNGEEWILPNKIGSSGFLDWKEFLQERYSGENNFTSKDIPPLKSKLVWDNSNLATKKEGKMWKKFLKEGSTTYMGASGVNYAPYSSEINTKFFKGGRTVGEALKNAVNDYNEDYITYDPFNMAVRGDAIKEKILREFILYGDPSIKKDPIITKDESIEKDVNCDEICKLDVRIEVPHKVKEQNNTRTIVTQSDDYLINTFKPIVPIKKFDYYLPEKARVINYTLKNDESEYENITLPVVKPLSHGNSYRNESTSNGVFPVRPYRLDINNTVDGRQRIQLVHSLIRYNERSKHATFFNNIKLEVSYNTPLEMEILPGIRNGREIGIELKNNIGSRIEGKINTKIINRTDYKLIEKKFELSPGKSGIVELKTRQRGKFLAKAVAITDDYKVGPRKRVFDRKEINFLPFNYLKISPDKIVKIYRNIKKRLKMYFTPSEMKIEEKNAELRFIHKLKNGKKITKVVRSDFKLTVTKSGDRVVNNLTSPYGKLVKIKERGDVSERLNGNREKLHSQYKLARRLIKQKNKRKIIN